MQANEFEKKIHDKMGAFEVLPKDEVWNAIAARLKEEKKRRVFVYAWSISAFLLLILFGSLWFINLQSPQKSVTKTKNLEEKSNVETGSNSIAKQGEDLAKKDH